ncbi:hypothetical protein WJ972_23255 [Achromobacter insuavis]
MLAASLALSMTGLSVAVAQTQAPQQQEGPNATARSSSCPASPTCWSTWARWAPTTCST